MPLEGGPRLDAATVTADEEAAYQAWARSPSAPVGHLVHIGYHGDSAVYPSWTQYFAKVSDFAPATGYRDTIRSLPSFKREISDDLRGPVTTSTGQLVLDNSTGTYDDLIRMAIDGQPLLVYHGDPSWAVGAFRLLFECIIEGVVGANEDSVTIRLRGKEHTANEPIQTNLLPDNVASNATSNLPIPLAFGNVFNVRPALVDEANQVYIWNDGAVDAVTDVRDSGIPFRTNQIAISAVDASSNTLSFATAHGFYPNTRVRDDVGSLPTATVWAGIAWNGRVFCAIAPSTAVTSVDGINWVTQTIPAGNWRAIAWNGRVFCTVASTADKFAVSPDGVNWTSGTLPVSGSYRCIAWNGSVFCTIAFGAADVLTSPDGVTWTAGTMSASASWHAIAVFGIAFCAVASGTTAATSLTGLTWTAQTLPSSGTWAAIGWNGQRLCALRSDAAVGAVSTDGVSWTGTTLTTTDFNAIAWNGDVFCAISTGGSNAAATSFDGITWTAQTLPTATTWYAIAWNGYRFCVLGNASNYVTLSPNGVTWTNVTNTLPSPLAINTDYWVMTDGLTPTTCKLTATRGGTTAVDLTTTTAGAALVGYHWTADLSTGYVYLDSQPAADYITLDGDAGDELASDILPVVLDATDIDTTSMTAFASTCPQPVGMYIAERRNRIEVANDLLSGLGAFYGYGRHGDLKAGRIEGSYGSHDMDLIEDQMDDGSFVLERLIPPAKQHRVGYRKNWTDQTGALAGVSGEALTLYTTPYSASPPSLGVDEVPLGMAGDPFHLLAIKPDVIESMMTYGSDALTEALRRNTMFYGWGAVFRCTVGPLGGLLDPGHVVRVRHWRYGCSAGVRMAVVSVEDRPTDRATVLKFFTALSNYTPGQI